MTVASFQRWSISLGRWAGVTIYLHVFFLLLAVLVLAFTVPDHDLAVAGGVSVAVLAVSLLLHELGHAWAAIRVGGRVDALVIGPVGGLLPPRVPDEPELHLFVALAGPLVHLTLVVLAAIALAIDGSTEVLSLLNPVATSVDLVEGSNWLIAVKLTLWLNLVLFLLNLLPTYPFDGGPVLRAMLWPAFGRRTARIITSRVAMGVAIALCASSLLTLLGHEFATRVPLWIPLVTLGIIVFFSARQDLVSGQSYELIDGMVGYRLDSDGLDLMDEMWSPDDDDGGVLVEHQQVRRHDEQQRNREAMEDARVDDILAKLHDSSLDDLPPEDVALLQRASQRYRQRRRLTGNDA